MFLFCMIFRSWSFSKKWSAMKDLLNDISHDYFRKKKIFPYLPVRRHNILYLTRYLVPAFWCHSVLLKIGQYTKRNLMIYSLSIFGKIIFVVTVTYDLISIEATRSLEKCDRTIFEIVSPTDDFQTIKNGITLVARLLK